MYYFDIYINLNLLFMSKPTSEIPSKISSLPTDESSDEQKDNPLTPEYSEFYNLMEELTSADSDIEIIEIVQRIPADFLNQSNGIQYPIHWAASHNATKTLKYLIEKKVDINSKNEHGATALHSLASSDKSYDIGNDKSSNMKLLLKNKADPFLANNEDVVPLYYAAINDNEECVKILAEQMKSDDKRGGVDFPCGKDKITALHGAANNGRIENVKALLKAGANINKQDRNGESPIFYAIRNNRENIIKLFIANKDLDLSIRNKHGRNAIDIERQEIDKEQKHGISREPIIRNFVKKQHVEKIKSLLSKTKPGEAELMDFIAEIFNSEYLNDIGLDTHDALDIINSPLDKDGNTIAHLAINTQNSALLSFLYRRIDQGIQFNIQNKSGETALDKIKKVVSKEEFTEFSTICRGLINIATPVKDEKKDSKDMNSVLKTISKHISKSNLLESASKLFGKLSFDDLIASSKKENKEELDPKDLFTTKPEPMKRRHSEPPISAQKPVIEQKEIHPVPKVIAVAPDLYDLEKPHHSSSSVDKDLIRRRQKDKKEEEAAKIAVPSTSPSKPTIPAVMESSGREQ